MNGFFFRWRGKPRLFLCLLLFSLAAYGTGRLYYHYTAGFTESNIYYSDLPYDPRWDTTPLEPDKKRELTAILSQPFYYLSKGCQSYVFGSADGKYVIKFFKYQRLRARLWPETFAFIPWVDEWQRRKVAAKKMKLDSAFASWKLAYEELRPETGVLYVQLNAKSEEMPLTIYDKLGWEHRLELNNMQFMLQRRAIMLCPALLALKAAGKHDDAKLIIDKLLGMIMGEYHRGYADNDHALMQNTGIYDNTPIHIDVGQFIKNSSVTEKKVSHRELFNKMWKFRLWLKNHYPELYDYSSAQLNSLIGPDFDKMEPQLEKGGVAKLPWESPSRVDP